MAHSLPRHNDETTKLTKILTDFAEEIIDISVVDHIETLEQQEINEKLAHYTQKLNIHGSRIVRENTEDVPILDNLTLKQINEQIQNNHIRLVLDFVTQIKSSRDSQFYWAILSI